MNLHLMTTALFFACICSFSLSLQAAEPSVQEETFTYKKVGDLEIKADIYRLDDQQKRPVVVEIHGGALMVGHRGWIKRHIKNELVKAGCVFVSIDYRLAPEVKLPEIIKDIEDAFTWIRDKGPELFNADPSRIAVMGGSAGGYLTFMTGFRIHPRPVALVSNFGYGDIIGDWYSTPSPHARHHKVKLSREDALKEVSGPPVSDDRNRKGNAGAFYQFCRQHGEWPKAVSTWDPHSEPEKFTPYMPVKNVTSEYPPTLMVHGTADTDVPYEQSVLMAEQFKQHGVPHRLITIENGEHGFGGGDRQKIDAAYREIVEFLKNHLGLHTNPVTNQKAESGPTVKLTEWERGLSVDALEKPDQRLFLWFYEWNMFDAFNTGQHNRGVYENKMTVSADGKSGVINSTLPGLQVEMRAVSDGAEMKLTVTNQSDHDWPELASIIPCFNPGPKDAPNPEFTNTKTWFNSSQGLMPLALKAPREIHYNHQLKPLTAKEADDKGEYVWTYKWPESEVDAVDGLIIRESTDGEWVTGIAWERFLSAQGHNPWKCMHLSINLGPLRQKETRVLRGKIYLFKGTKEELLTKYKQDFNK